MPVDEKRRLEELKAEIRQIGNLVVWTEKDLKLALEVASTKTDLTNLALDQILIYEQLKFDRTSEILFEFKSFIPLVHDDLKAISESSVSSSSIIKESIDSSNTGLLKGLGDINKKAMTAKAVGGGDMGGLSAVSGAAAGLEALPIVKKVEAFLDAATLFLKAWSSPVNVGIALAIPIVGGLAVIFGGYYLIFSKLTDAVISISHDVRDVARGGLSGLIFGSDSSSSSSSNTEISNEAANSIVAAINSSRESITTGIFDIGTNLVQIENTNEAILNRLNAASFLFRNVINASKLAIGTMAGLISDTLGMSRRQNTNEVTNEETVAYDTEFQNDLLVLLRSTLSVKVENLPKISENQEKPAEVFANAIKPITANQEALFKSLDSGLRRLNETVISLREANTDSRISLLSKPIDSTDVRISDNSEQYLLEATQDILSEVRRFYVSFEEYKTMWSGKNSDNGVSKSSGQNPPVSGA
jgi:hypothetical protein